MENKEKVYFRSQILEFPSIGEYWNTFGIPVLPENVIFTFFRMCWCYSEAYNTGTQKWSSIVQYSCTSIWDLKYTFFQHLYQTKDKNLTAATNLFTSWDNSAKHRNDISKFWIRMQFHCKFFKNPKIFNCITTMLSKNMQFWIHWSFETWSSL